MAMGIGQGMEERRDTAVRDVTTVMARTLVDEWARLGMRDACLAPGSRSTPLALALASDSRIRLHVFLDERSAAFFALGAAKASGVPTLVLCTSGTAAANFFPAVIEASMARVALIVCTADRPPELRDTGAPQTIDQLKLYGDSVRWFCEIGAPEGHREVAASWRPIACRAFDEALGGVGRAPGPVHCNVALREPLVPTGDSATLSGRAAAQPWTRTRRGTPVLSADELDGLAHQVSAAQRGVVLVGWTGVGQLQAATVDRFARVTGWPVLADPLSNVRCGAHAISTYEALLRSPGFLEAHRPDMVVRVGAALTSKLVAGWLDADVLQVVVDPDDAWPDPGRAISSRLVADPNSILEGLAERLEGLAEQQDVPGIREPASSHLGWGDVWRHAEAAARGAIDELIDSWSEPFEGRIARDLAACLPDGSTLVVGSSMPVRDLEAFVGSRSGLRVLANRGANGIDGFTSTVLGVAAGLANQLDEQQKLNEGSRPVVGLCGDLAFLHDTNGLIGAARRGFGAVVVVIDNDGGGIFSFLPQADDPEHFERLFGTPHGLDLVDIARAHGVGASRITHSFDLIPAVEKVIAAGGVHVIVVSTDRSRNVELHREVWAAVAAALRV